MAGRRKLAAAAALVAACALAAAPGALAATDYHPDPDARSFADSAGGWAGQTENSNPSCVEGVVCPTVDEVFVPDGGADGAGDGYISSRLTGLASLLTTTTSTLAGPPFTYDGDRGERPSRLRFTLARRSDDGALVSALAGGDFSVFLDDLTAGIQMPLIEPRAFADTGGWVDVAPVAIPPAQLTLGHEYRVRIVNRLDLPVAVIPSGSFDYDNVTLRAVGDAVSVRELRAGVRSATLRGRRLRLRLRCPADAPRQCRYSLVPRLWPRIGGCREAPASPRAAGPDGDGDDEGQGAAAGEAARQAPDHAHRRRALWFCAGADRQARRAAHPPGLIRPPAAPRA